MAQHLCNASTPHYPLRENDDTLKSLFTRYETAWERLKEFRVGGDENPPREREVNTWLYLIVRRIDGSFTGAERLSNIVGNAPIANWLITLKTQWIALKTKGEALGMQNYNIRTGKRNDVKSLKIHAGCPEGDLRFIDLHTCWHPLLTETIKIHGFNHCADQR